MLGDGTFPCKNVKTGCEHKSDFLRGMFTILAPCSPYFHPLEALLTRTIVAGTPTCNTEFFPAPCPPESHLQSKMCASHLSCHPMGLGITSIVHFQPIHHTLTLWSLKSSPSSVADKAAASSNTTRSPCTRAEKMEFGFFSSLTKQSQRAPGVRRRKSLLCREPWA